jgi:hypothetical protein
MSEDRCEVFRTARLRARLATADDADLICSLWSDPRVMTHIGFPESMRAHTCPVHHYVYRLSRTDWGRRQGLPPPTSTE